MLQILKSKTVRLCAVVAVVLAAYAIAGFVVAPRVVRSSLLKDIPAAIDATPSVGEIHINPFLLQATIDDFALADAAHSPVTDDEQKEKQDAVERLFEVAGG